VVKPTTPRYREGVSSQVQGVEFQTWRLCVCDFCSVLVALREDCSFSVLDTLRPNFSAECVSELKKSGGTASDRCFLVKSGAMDSQLVVNKNGEYAQQVR